uniref:Uncharacterized protein n=1 Tax=Panagrolaimus davidi TaxID=227884 RepID=A0A914PPM3_9BILA
MVKSTLKEANQILSKFAANLAYVLFPRIPTIFLAFAYFVDGNLQIGIYLSGLLKRRIPLTQNNESAFDMSCHVAYKVKEILANILSVNEIIHVSIKNSVPSEGTDFTDQFYEYIRGGNIFSWF